MPTFIDFKGNKRAVSHRGQMNRTDQQEYARQHGEGALEALPDAPEPCPGSASANPWESLPGESPRDRAARLTAIARSEIAHERASTGGSPLDAYQMSRAAAQRVAERFGRSPNPAGRI